MRRLEILESTSNGQDIAEEDLKLRQAKSLMNRLVT